MLDIVTKINEKMHTLSSAQIEGILALLVKNPGIKNNKLIQLTGLPRETLREFKSVASTILNPAEDDSISIRKEQFTELQSLNLSEYNWTLLHVNDTTLEKEITTIRKTYPVVAGRELDQFFATPQTTVAKALLFKQKGVQADARIGVLGDDDMVSIALALSGYSKAAIIVFEFDTKLIATLKKICSDKGINNVQFVQYDVRSELPGSYLNKFDVVITDPPYTKTGAQLFLKRALQLMRLDNLTVVQKYLFFYFGTSFKTPEKSHKIQEIINQTGLVIEDLLYNFARYDGAESIGSSSSCYILRPLKSASTDVELLSINSAGLYTNQLVKEEKFPFVDHVVCKIYGVPTSIVGSKKGMAKAVGDFITQHKLNVVDQKFTNFKNGGLTMTFILSNSNLVVHTWPEFNAVHLDLITCAPIYNKKFIAHTLSECFKTQIIEIRNIE